MLPLPLHKLDIVDVGARLTEEPRYGSLLTKNVARLLGFEAEESQLEVLEQNFPGHQFIQAFVGDGSYLLFNSDIYSSVITNNKLIIVVCDNGGHAVINRLQLYNCLLYTSPSPRD